MNAMLAVTGARSKALGVRSTEDSATAGLFPMLSDRSRLGPSRRFNSAQRTGSSNRSPSAPASSRFGAARHGARIIMALQSAEASLRKTRPTFEATLPDRTRRSLAEVD